MSDEQDQAGREALSLALMKLKWRLESERRTGTLDYSMAGELADRIGDGNALGKLDAGDVDRAQVLLERYGMKVVPMGEVSASARSGVPVQTQLTGRLADLRRRLKGQHQHLTDWRRALELEDRIGGGWTLPNDVADAEALLAAHKM